MYFHLCNNPLGVDRTFLILQLKETEALIKGVAGPSSLWLQSRSFLHHRRALRAARARPPNSTEGTARPACTILVPCQSGPCRLSPALTHPLEVGSTSRRPDYRSANPLAALVSGDWTHSRSPDSASALPLSLRYLLLKSGYLILPHTCSFSGASQGALGLITEYPNKVGLTL